MEGQCTEPGAHRIISGAKKRRLKRGHFAAIAARIDY